MRNEWCRIMLKTNRLIDDFKRQTKITIWKHIEAMAVNYAVYSYHLNGFDPYLRDKDIYVYSNSDNMMVVCLDRYGRHDNRTYEESDGMDSIIYSTGCEPRESMVWKLKETLQIMRNRLQKCQYNIEVYGVLLTEAHITNADDLEDMWEANHIKVFEGFCDLKHRRARVNADDTLPGKIYFGAAIDVELDAECDAHEQSAEDADKSKPTIDENDDFERMLTDFINSQFEEVHSTQEEDDESASLQLPEEEDDEPEDVVIPDGNIEQNGAVSVKVEILRPIANPREELDKLIGCDDIKRRMDELVALTSYNKMKRALFPECRQHEVSLHSIFFGRPGTGKTTVCKIFGSLLRQAGALSKGHVVVCDRGSFIGTLWGDEERSLRQVLEKAKGGVLMIDEAYLLNGKNENDPGKLVIQLLMNILADETQRDIAVVLCGYKDQMQKLLEMNPGLQSRFPNKFEFQDFTIDELLEITKSRVKEFEYQFTDQAWNKYRGMLAQAYQVRDPQTWGNARFVANQLERIYIQHATRCVKQQPKDKSELLVLTPEDIIPIEVPRPRTRIGF